MERNGTDRNGTDRNGTERNGMERCCCCRCWKRTVNRNDGLRIGTEQLLLEQIVVVVVVIESEANRMEWNAVVTSLSEVN